MADLLDRTLAAFGSLGTDPSPEAVGNALAVMTEDISSTNGELPDTRLAVVREAVIKNLSKAGAGAPANMANAAIKDARAVSASVDADLDKYADPEPWPDPVDGDEILCEVVELIAPYLYVTPEKIDTVAAWAIATYFVDEVYCAPILAVLAPTKECGKTRVLDVLAPIVRRPHVTSGPGITVATMFRLQDKYRPTIIIDEAECLGDRRGHSN